YHGRIDYQVKVRGFRIELGEIEAAMQKLPGVQDAVVVARGDALDDKTLAALWTADTCSASQSSENILPTFKHLLAQALPEYMVPTIWMRLHQYPLSVNGKIDRKWLTTASLHDIEEQYGVSKGRNGTCSADTDTTAFLNRPESLKSTSQAPKVMNIDRVCNEAVHERMSELDQVSISKPLPDKELKAALQRLLDQDIGAVIAEMMNLDASQLDRRANLIESGFNSIKFISLSARLDELYGIRIAPPQFFDFASTSGIIHYFLNHCQEQLKLAYAERLQQMQGDVNREPASTGIPALNDAARHAPAAVASHSTNPIPHFDTAEQRAIDEDPSIAEDLDEDWMDSAVAIIGMDARTPGASSIAEMWNNLVQGIEVITEIPAERWSWRDVSGDETKARWGGFIADVDKFDAGFFGVPEDKARQMDPQQRLMLETSWKAVEDAGYRMSELSASHTGVFMAVAYTDYMDVLRESGHNADLHAAAGMERTLIPNMISHYFDLTGPSEAIDTACSSSLTALSRGMEALRSGACDVAIVGASNLILSPRLFTVFDELGKLSSDGRCKTFDKDADGYVRSEGVIAVVLKPFRAALADKDHIHAVVRGCITRHIGRSSAFTAPKSTSQSDLIKETYGRHDVDIRTLGYVEVHGPGISLVDAVEVNALSRTMVELLEKVSPEAKAAFTCGIGSVKSNLGHMEAASGLAGLVKIVMSMQQGVIPGNRNIQELNPYLELKDSPLYIVQSNTPWQDSMYDAGRRMTRRAGISSFGGGGVIAHAIVEEHVDRRGAWSDEDDRIGAAPKEYAIPLSAKNEQSLYQYAADLAAFVQNLLLHDLPSDIPLQHLQRHHASLSKASRPYRIQDIAYTLQVGREEFEERLGLTASGLKELHHKLSLFVQGKLPAYEYLRGKVREDEHESALWSDDAIHHEVRLSADQQQYSARELLQQWTSGKAVAWVSCMGSEDAYRIPLPTYPFLKKRYWVEAGDKREDMVVQL
ncbi:beta-ketoacyl synthase N-terminal-like domain-containing protein, partial [Paenibacillus sp. 1001270B_150601_E10]|uniref:beta-ketoacyl synthase N-terminal-like domain-containing protein n=1 Tax=Paenibacillus sp. 1001270B_150601_E10 TaxID=2787079 RepID=UPI001E5188D2